MQSTPNSTKTLGDTAEIKRKAAAQSEVSLLPGASLGRYRAERRLGRGGMGEVWLAHDDELDRDVAVKVLRSDLRSSRGQGRMLREAQAMARLRHPNVVAVHDVGTWSGRVFIAMEYVRGPTLSVWLQTPRSRAEILETFDGAARGLAAAHDAGLVHRDFKPDNVMVDDGRVQVMDFGLARAPGGRDAEPLSGDGESYSDHPVEDDLSGASLISQRLTATGAVLGTPAYMAPEQHLRIGADARSDQFAFAVALYEALFKTRPFAGSSPLELAANVTTGNRATPPKEVRVPARLRRVLDRALARQPNERYPSMRALRSALARATDRRRWPWAFAGVGAAVAFVAATPSPTPGVGTCEAAAEAIGRVWTPSARTTARQAFDRTSLGFAADTYARVDEGIASYEQTLRDEATEACRDTRVRGVQSESALDRRLGCLRARHARLAAFVDDATAADIGVVIHAAELVASLPPVAMCRTPSDVAAGGESLSDEHAALLDEADVALRMNRVEPALAVLDALQSQLDASQPTRALALALALRGEADRRRGKRTEALELQERGLWMATTLGLDDVVVTIATELVQDSVAEDPHTAERWLQYASAVHERLVDPPAELRLSLAAARVRLLSFGGQHAEAVTVLEDSLASVGPANVSASSLLRMRSYLAVSLARQGKLAEALVEQQRIVTEKTALLGPNHPGVADALLTLADFYVEVGDQETAEREATAALAILESGYRQLPEELDRALASLARVRMRGGDFEGAIPFLERRLAQRKADSAVLTLEAADTASLLGVAYWYVGRYPESEQMHRLAREVSEQRLGSDHPRTAMYMDNLGTALERQGHFAEALLLHQKALPLLEAAHGPGSPTVAVSLRDHARALATAKRWDDAAAMLERSVRIFNDAGSGMTELAETRFDLAQVLWELPGANARSVSLAHTARRDYDEAGRVDEVAEVDAWLAAHEPAPATP